MTSSPILQVTANPSTSIGGVRMFQDRIVIALDVFYSELPGNDAPPAEKRREVHELHPIEDFRCPDQERVDCERAGVIMFKCMPTLRFGTVDHLVGSIRGHFLQIGDSP
ncbi:MAG: hypothetical protein JO353_11065, partial [Phycisphaerae bacterium]|nr:hypothetical protein [Phycisphaerae bacterium]